MDGTTAVERAWQASRKARMLIRMGRSLGVIAVALLFTTAAYGEEPSSVHPAAPVSRDATCAPASVSDTDAEDRAFSAALDSFARRRAFTERLIAERNAELFEQAIARQARAAEPHRRNDRRDPRDRPS